MFMEFLPSVLFSLGFSCHPFFYIIFFVIRIYNFLNSPFNKILNQRAKNKKVNRKALKRMWTGYKESVYTGNS